MEGYMTALDELRKIDDAKDEYLKDYQIQRAVLVKSVIAELDKQAKLAQQTLEMVTVEKAKLLGEAVSEPSKSQVETVKVNPSLSKEELARIFKGFKAGKNDADCMMYLRKGRKSTTPKKLRVIYDALPVKDSDKFIEAYKNRKKQQPKGKPKSKANLSIVAA
jgi:hypothetical protein